MEIPVKKKRRALPLSCDLSSYPLQAPCEKCGRQDRGPLGGSDGLCFMCSKVAQIRAEACGKASPGPPSSPGGEGAVERPQAPSRGLTRR